jgi:hypothetical protein
LATRQARRQEMSKNLAQCSNEDRQDVHDAHGQERDSDHCQPRKNELIHVLGRAVFASLWQEQSRATGPGAVRTFDLPGPVHPGNEVRQSRISASQQIEQLPSCWLLSVASSRVDGFAAHRARLSSNRHPQFGRACA